MKFVLTLLALLCTFSLQAESEVPEPVDPPAPQQQPLILLPGPADWVGERIPLPPEFAPELPFTGLEEIRFAPGMWQPEAEDFFSFLFAFELTSHDSLVPDEMDALLTQYYQGLCRTVSETEDGSTAECPVTLEVTTVVGGYLATLDWVEPFVTNQPQRLFLELVPGQRNGKAMLYGAASPQDLEHAQWQKLRLYLHPQPE